MGEKQKNLPRYKPGEEVKRTRETVNIEGLGSFVLERPSYSKQLAYEARDTSKNTAAEKTAELLSHVLVEPELTEAEILKEIESWDSVDVMNLSSRAMKLCVIGEEDLRSAQTEFRPSDDE